MLAWRFVNRNRVEQQSGNKQRCIFHMITEFTQNKTLAQRLWEAFYINEKLTSL